MQQDLRRKERRSELRTFYRITPLTPRSRQRRNHKRKIEEQATADIASDNEEKEAEANRKGLFFDPLGAVLLDSKQHHQVPTSKMVSTVQVSAVVPSFVPKIPVLFCSSSLSSLL